MVQGASNVLADTFIAYADMLCANGNLNEALAFLQNSALALCPQSRDIQELLTRINEAQAPAYQAPAPTQTAGGYGHRSTPGRGGPRGPGHGGYTNPPQGAYGNPPSGHARPTTQP